MKVSIVLLLYFFLYPVCSSAQTNNANNVVEVLKSVTHEADWPGVKEKLSREFEPQQADSILSLAKIEYYWQRKDYNKYLAEYIKFVETNKLQEDPGSANGTAWRIFEFTTDEKQLQKIKLWMLNAIDAQPTNAYFVDTYANILYKSGNVKEAINWQNRAVWYGKLDPVFIETLYKMKAAIPTWKYPEASNKLIDTRPSSHTWSTIRQNLKRSVDSLVWLSQLNVSKSKNDSSSYATTLITYIEEFIPNVTAVDLNGYAWEVFQYTNRKSELKKALIWSNKSLNNKLSSSDHYAYLDTNANLLYKLGKHKQAIAMQQKAIAMAPESEKPAYEATLTKMKQGLPTWP